MNKKQLIIVWAIVLLLNGCATLGLSPLKDRMLQSVKYSKDELAAADGENKAIVSKYGVVDDPRSMARLDSIKKRLEAVLPRKDIDFNIHILNSKDVNAMTTGGRHIYVFKGLLNSVDSDDELACIIAHEMAHSLSRHRAKMTTISVLTAIGSIAVGTVTGGQSSVQTIIGLSAQALPATFSRADEKEADVLAADFAYRAGYDISRARNFFKKLAEQERLFNIKANTELIPALNMAAANYNTALNNYSLWLYYYRNWPNANNYHGLVNSQNQLNYYYGQLQKVKGDYLNFSLDNIGLFRTHPDSMSRANLYIKLSDYMRGLISAEALARYDKQAINILNTLKEIEGLSSQGFMNQNGVRALELFKKAKTLYDNKKYEAAESLLKEVLNLKPDYQEAVRLQADLAQLIKNRKR
ncbi:MAG: M48 family metalloprotease [Candidatus Omnitrophica bacterium]|nr:M48 family metalloprotease [Candidatus Omnitrophota bacterium]